MPGTTQPRVRKPRVDTEERHRVLRVAKLVSATLGTDFFRLFTECLAGAVGAHCAYVAEVVGGPVSRLKPIAIYGPQGQSEGFPQHLSGTASYQVLLDGIVAWSTGAKRIFPLDPLLKEAEGYVGVRLCGSAGQVLGLLAVASTQPLGDLALVRSVLETFAPRTAAELERKRADDALRESEERHRAFIALNPDAMWRIEFELPIPLNLPEDEQIESIYHYGYVAECNDALARLVDGGKVEDLIGMPFAALFSRADERIRNELRAAIRAGHSVITFETTPLGEDGQKHYRLRTQFGIVEKNELQRIWGTTRDVTELKRAELAAEASERRFREVLEGIELPALILDTGGAIAFCNDSLARLAGSSKKELNGKNWLEQNDSPEDRGIWESLVFRPSDLHSSHRHFEGMVRFRDVPQTRVAWSAIALRSPDGEPTGVAAIGRDVTHERATAARLLQAQKLESLGRLAGGVAHDFNNLLTVIMGYITTVLKGIDPGEPNYRRLSEAELAAEQCAALAQQLLAVGRRQHLQPAFISLNDVISTEEAILRHMIARDIEFVTDLDSSVELVYADPVQIRRILANLVKNASDAMPQGGRLIVATSNADVTSDRWVGQTNIPCGRYVALSVSDTGIGLTDEVKEHMFDPFFSTKAPGEGTGLGLSTVYGIVAQSGGYISVRSEGGAGTVFEILLPRSQTIPGDSGTSEK